MFKKIFALDKIIFTFFLSQLFFTPLFCHTLSPDVSLFLENLMIRDCGIYTLLGSKPMTEFDITESSPATEEELAESYEELKLFLEKAKQDPEHYHANGAILPSFEEFKRKCLTHSLAFLEKRKLWNDWLEAKINISNPLFKLIETGNENKMGLFIHIPQTVYILKKYQNEFSALTSIKFDPDNILDSIDDKNSVFWNRVFVNHYLMGLLFGYGEKNAYLFDYIRRQGIPFDLASISRFPQLSRMEEYMKKVLKKKISIKDLPIPFFASFEIDDPQVSKYSKERKKIIKFLKDRDIDSFVLECLTKG